MDTKQSSKSRRAFGSYFTLGTAGSKALPSDVNWDSETAKNYGSYVHLLLENLPVHPTENWPQITNNLRVKLEQPIDDDIALHAFESAKQVLGAPDLSWIFEKDAFAEVPLSRFCLNIPSVVFMGSLIA